MNPQMNVQFNVDPMMQQNINLGMPNVQMKV